MKLQGDFMFPGQIAGCALRVMRRRGRAVVAAFAVASVCLSGFAPRSNAAEREHSTPLVWPKPPDVARMQYGGFIHSEADIGRKKSLLGRVKKALVGGEDRLTVLVRPHDVHVDSRGRIFVTDRAGGGRLLVFEPRSSVGKVVVPTGSGDFVKPLGLGGDSLDRLYVTDPVRKRIVALTSDGAFERTFGNPSLLLNPVDVAVSSSGDRVYVADSYLHQLVIFDGNGDLVRRVGRDAGVIGAAMNIEVATDTASSDDGVSSDIRENRSEETGAFRYPGYVALGPDDTVYVTDCMNFRIQAFDRDGNYLRAIGQLGQTPGSFARPKGVGVDSKGHVYVADAAFNNVQVFSPNGQLLMAFGRFGSARGEFWQPLGLDVSGDRIFVADRFNDRVQFFDYLHVDEDAASVEESGGGADARNEE